MSRSWNEFVGALLAVVPLPLMLVLLFVVATLVARAVVLLPGLGSAPPAQAAVAALAPAGTALATLAVAAMEVALAEAALAPTAVALAAAAATEARRRAGRTGTGGG